MEAPPKRVGCLSLEIYEDRQNGWVRLSLLGALDIGSARALEERLSRLRAGNLDVRFDLSKLEFIDSTGLQVLIQAVQEARAEGRRLEVEPDLAPQVERLFDLIGANHMLVGISG
jgi:anti-anti-sigma factor